MSGAEGYPCRHSLPATQCVLHPDAVIVSCPEGRPVAGSRGGRGPDHFLSKMETQTWHRGSSAKLRGGISPPALVLGGSEYTQGHGSPLLIPKVL